MISNKVEYMLFILMNLARRDDDEFVPSKKIAEEESIPVNYVPQLMSILTKKGWVESVRGVNGGVRLVTDPADITVQDVIRNSGDPFYIKKCLVEDCSFDHSDDCRLLSLWQKAQKQVDQVMEGVTIADLAEDRMFTRGREKTS